ncbi:MAG: histidine phosphatase family protein [Anaerolineae bacterium]
MKLYLIRHAESANNAILSSSGDPSGRSPDPEITEIGHKQAALLGKHMANPAGEPRQHPFEAIDDHHFGLTHLYCSLMTRSILTSSYIAKECNLQSVAHLDIFERGGIYQQHPDRTREGLPGPGKGYFEKRFPDLLLPDNLNPTGWYSRPAEEEAPFVDRVKRAAADIRERHADSDDVVGMVVHGDFIDQFVNELMGVERKPKNYSSPWVANWAFHNTSLSRIDFRDDSHTILYLNRIDHLPAELITW